MAKRRAPARSVLDQKQKALEEEEAKLRLKMEQLQQMIEDAPRRAALEEKRRREEIVARSRVSSHRSTPRGALADKRYELYTGRPERPRRKALKAERREARLKFVGLCILLAGLIIFLFSRF